MWSSVVCTTIHHDHYQPLNTGMVFVVSGHCHISHETLHCKHTDWSKMWSRPQNITTTDTTSRRDSVHVYGRSLPCPQTHLVLTIPVSLKGGRTNMCILYTSLLFIVFSHFTTRKNEHFRALHFNFFIILCQ